MSDRVTMTSTRNGKTVCAICGKDVGNAPCLKDADAVFADMDKLFKKIGKMFDRWFP